MAAPLAGKKAELERRIRAREFVFGIQDGLLSTVGLLSGVSAATQSRAVVTVTGIAAGVTGGISMAAGAYLAARTEQDIFDKELVDQERLVSDQPYLVQEALLQTLESEGLDRPSAYRVVQTLSRRRDIFLRTVQEKVLGLGTADLTQPVRGSLVMFLSFLIGACVPVLPYVLLARGALVASWALSVATLLAVGVWKGAITRRPYLRSGAEFAGVALGAALVGWLIGRALNVEVP
jgi:VIT1/CCC1 family predicted Fe2+/Mn2+ transporter